MLKVENRKRGAVAIRLGKGWKAAYNEYRSNPTLFGPELWEILQENWKSLSRFGVDVLKAAYWEDYLNGGLCPYCGKFDKGHPHSIQGNLIQDIQNGLLAPDPDAKYHTHGIPTACLSSSNEDIDGLWIEWVYVIDHENYMLEVLKSVRDKGTRFVIRPGQKWEQDRYRYVSVGMYSLFGDEPIWSEVEHKGLKMSAYYYDKYPRKISRVKK